MSSAFEHCERLLREHDKDRYLAALFAPPERRPLLHAVYAFDLEIASVSARVREPLAGEIRLQWWRDVIGGERVQEAAAAPVAAALLATIEAAKLDRTNLLSVIDARSDDLNLEAIPTLEEFACYASRVTGSVLIASVQALGAPEASELDEIICDASFTLTACDALRNLAAGARPRRLLIPAELLARHGLHENQVTARQGSEPVRAALAEFSSAARTRANAAMTLAARLPEAARPAFLGVALVPLYLDWSRKFDARPLEVPQWRRQWKLWRFARSLRRVA